MARAHMDESESIRKGRQLPGQDQDAESPAAEDGIEGTPDRQQQEPMKEIPDNAVHCLKCKGEGYDEELNKMCPNCGGEGWVVPTEQLT